MVQPEFGENVDIVGPLRQLLKTSPKLCSTDSKLVLLELYEKTFGIYNHDMEDPERPMANVAMHWAENVSDGSLLDEILDLPSDMCMKILELSTQKQAEENTIAANAINQLGKAGA